MGGSERPSATTGQLFRSGPLDHKRGPLELGSALDSTGTQARGGRRRGSPCSGNVTSPAGGRSPSSLSSAGARSVVLQAPSKAGLRTVRSGTFTRPVSAAKGDAKYTIGCSGRSCAGAVFDIVLASRAPVEWLIIATTPGLPPEAKPLVQARPSFARPQYTPDATISISRVRM
jgi:hypothetical protein